MEEVKIFLETGEELDAETLEQGLDVEIVTENPEIELYWASVPEKRPENPFILGLEIDELADFASSYSGEQQWRQVASSHLDEDTVKLLNHEIDDLAGQKREDDRRRYSDFAMRATMHDVKNVLQTLEGYLELYKETCNEEYLGTAVNASKDIRLLYEDLETLQNLYEEDKETHINAYSLIQEIDTKLESREEQTGSHLHLPETNTSHSFRSSPLVEKMMYNLLDNSLEHGQKDPEIDIYKENGHIAIEVYDDGEIPGKVWENWSSEDHEPEDYPGTGTFLIGEIARRNNIKLEPLENGYRAKIPET